MAGHRNTPELVIDSLREAEAAMAEASRHSETNHPRMSRADGHSGRLQFQCQ